MCISGRCHRGENKLVFRLDAVSLIALFKMTVRKSCIHFFDIALIFLAIFRYFFRVLCCLANGYSVSVWLLAISVKARKKRECPTQHNCKSFKKWKAEFILRLTAMTIEEGFIQERRQWSSLLFGGQNYFNSLPHYRFTVARGWLKKWMSRKMGTWQNGCFAKKWMIFQFTPHQTGTLPNRMFFQNLFFKSSLLLNG